MKTEKIIVNIEDFYYQKIKNYTSKLPNVTWSYSTQTVITDDIRIIIEFINCNGKIEKEIIIEYNDKNKKTEIKSKNRCLIDYLHYNSETRNKIKQLIEKYNVKNDNYFSKILTKKFDKTINNLTHIINNFNEEIKTEYFEFSENYSENSKFIEMLNEEEIKEFDKAKQSIKDFIVDNTNLIINE